MAGMGQLCAIGAPTPTPGRAPKPRTPAVLIARVPLSTRGGPVSAVATPTPVRSTARTRRTRRSRRPLGRGTALVLVTAASLVVSAAGAPAVTPTSPRAVGETTGVRVDGGPITAGAGAGAVVTTDLNPYGVQAFVTAAYVDFLGRQPTAGELSSWGAQIQAGTVGTTDLTAALSRSSEWITGVITRFYTDTLGRQPDPSGLASWITAARGGASIAQIASGFYGSPEYFATIGRGDYRTWVMDLYRKLLLRDPDPGGIDAWVAALQGGATLPRVAIGFYQSPEKLAARIQALYSQLLGRGAEPGGVASWSPIVAAQGDLVLAAGIAGSQEYWNRALARFPSSTPPSWAKVVGTGTPASCTSAALAAAVRSGGTIVFSCGPDPVTIVVDQILFTCNTTTCQHPWQGGTPVTSMTLDGGGLVTLSGGGVRPIYYANACEEQFGWLTSACQNDTRPHITFQNITFADGNAQGGHPGFDGVGGGGGGGAISMRSGRLTLDHVTFRNNVCVAAHSDAGGGAVRVTGMTSQVEVTASTFTNNRCANGGALSSLHAPMVITDSVFTGNVATGHGASDGLGGNGGAIYFDGTSENVTVVNSTITGNVAPEGGPGIFYVSNDRSGSLTIQGSTITGNTGQSFYTSPYRSLFFLGRALSISGSSVG